MTAIEQEPKSGERGLRAELTHLVAIAVEAPRHPCPSRGLSFSPSWNLGVKKVSLSKPDSQWVSQTVK